MKYLVISADINSTGIRDEFGYDLNQGDLCVSDELWRDLSEWVRDYSIIIPMSMGQRKTKIDTIQQLDKRGLELRNKFLEELEDVKIKYYSEGVLAHLVEY